jgi:hypothetical protein
MSSEQDQHFSERPASTLPLATPGLPDTGEELLPALRRIERLLVDIRGHLEATARAHRHRDFSLSRLVAALLQALVVGLVIAALADWAYQTPPGAQLVKLAFAGVLQLGALTALVLAQGGRSA